MPKQINPAFGATFAPPVMEARRWLDGIRFTPERPLINVSQAAPVDPPPAALLAALAQTVLDDPGAHLYGPVLGLPDLRAEIADQWSTAYGGEIKPDQVAITSGCNQAFCAAIATLAGAGGCRDPAGPLVFQPQNVARYGRYRNPHPDVW